MSVEILNNGIANNAWKNSAQAKTIESHLNPTTREARTTTPVSSDILQITHLVRGRAEMAALQLASGQHMAQASELQTAQSALQDIHAIIFRLMELASHAEQATTTTSAASLEAEVQRLGQQVHHILITSNPAQIARPSHEPAAENHTEAATRTDEAERARQNDAPGEERGLDLFESPAKRDAFVGLFEGLKLETPSDGETLATRMQKALEEGARAEQRLEKRAQNVRSDSEEFDRFYSDLATPDAPNDARNLTESIVRQIQLTPEQLSLAQVHNLSGPPIALLPR